MSFAKRVVIRHGLYLWVLVGLLLAMSPLEAEEVRLYNTPPSVDDVRQTLFPEMAPAPEKLVRTIHMLPAAVPQILQTTTPAPAADVTLKPKKVHSVTVAEKQPNTSSAQASAVMAIQINFSYNSAEIGANQATFLDPIGQAMAADSSGKSRLTIEGHTDAKGSPAYNYELSRRRAETTKQYLVSHYEINPIRLTAVGKGQRELLVKDDPQDERNRRVQFRRQ